MGVFIGRTDAGIWKIVPISKGIKDVSEYTFMCFDPNISMATFIKTLTSKYESYIRSYDSKTGIIEWYRGTNVRDILDEMLKPEI